MYLLGRSLTLREHLRPEPTTLLDTCGNSADGGEVFHGHTGPEGLMVPTCLYIVGCQAGWGRVAITMRGSTGLLKADSHRNAWPKIYHGDSTVWVNDPCMPFCILLPLKERPSLFRNALWLFLNCVVGGIGGIPKVISSCFAPKDQLNIS